MRLCFECGLQCDSSYCPQDGLITFQTDGVAASCDLAVDRVVEGHYRVGAQLGRGGMGVVYAATHVRTGGTLALKVLHLPEQARRFYHEARATSRLAPHPHLIHVFDFGQTEEGVFFLAMERLVGETVDERLRRCGRLSESEATEILLQVLEGLAHAHSGGLLHRDLKTSNLFLHRLREGREIAKILDFGIVKTEGVALTQDGHLLGTAEYMAPERCLEGQGSDRRSDLYSLGVILFEMVTGEPPFVADSLGAVLGMQVHRPAPDVRERVADISPGFGEVVARALRKDPAERFQDAQAMRSALEEAHAARTQGGRGLYTGVLPVLPQLHAPSLLFPTGVMPVAPAAAPPTPAAAPPAAAPPVTIAEPPRPGWLALLAERIQAQRRRVAPRQALLLLAGVLLLLGGALLLPGWRARRAAEHCEGAAVDPARRLNACRLACDQGTRSASCARLGDLLRGQAGTAAAAVLAYGKGCAGGDLPACAAQGQLLLRGAGPASESAQALLLLLRACEGGVAASCEELAALHGGALVPGVSVDDARATGFYQRACALGRAESCFQAAQRFDQGRGVARDRIQAAALYQRACAAEHTGACHLLGLQLLEGRGVARDPHQAAPLLQRTCQARYLDACYQLGGLYETGRGVPKDEGQAAALYRAACEGGEVAGCSRLGDLYMGGRGVPRDRTQGVELLRKGCRAGHGWACNYLREL